MGSEQGTKRPTWPKGGRPEKLNQEIINTICNCMKMGVFLETAVQFAGISKETFHDWIRKGRTRPNSIYGRFSDAVLKAGADAIVRKVSYVDTAGKSDWRAAAWHLERLSSQFANKQSIKVEDENTPAEKSSFTDQDLHKVLCDIINEDKKEE